jgi:hypothetical protein
LTTRHQRGDLAGAEKYFTAGLNFFGDLDGDSSQDLVH